MTAAVTAPGKRAATYNPALRRHSWVKGEEHHKTCAWCALHVENREGARGRWYQVWTAPGKPAENNYAGGKIPTCPGPAAVAAAPASSPAKSAEPPTCSTCGEALLALAPLVFDGGTGGLVPLAAKDPEGEFVAVKRGEQWTVRAYVRGEDVDPARRRRRHRCGPYRYPCLGHAGQCPDKGRLYPGGTFCDVHRPGSPVTPLASVRASDMPG